jgi:hypothetical protein
VFHQQEELTMSGWLKPFFDVFKRTYKGGG